MSSETSRQPSSKFPLIAGFILLVAFFAWRAYNERDGFDVPPEIPAGGTWFNAQNGLKFANLKGKVVLIQFSFLGCGPCRAMDQYMHRWHDELGSEGLVVIEVDDGRADDLESIRRWVEQAGVTFPVYYDAGGKMTTEYKINSYPTRFIIGRDGKVFEKNGGWGGERGVQEIEKSLKKALAAK